MIRIPEIALLLTLVFLNGGLAQDSRGRELGYREIKDGRTIRHTFHIQRQGDGCAVSLRSEADGRYIYQNFLLDPQWDTRTWNYQDTGRNTRITARRQEGTIFLDGIHRGKDLRRKFRIGDGFWNQLFHIGLAAFAVGSEEVRFFHAIGTSGIGDMKIARFRAVRAGTETIILDGESRDSIHITISLAGVRSVLWTGHYWFDRVSGLFLRYLNRPDDPDRGDRMALVNR